MYACIPPFPLLLAELGAASIAPCKLHTHTQGHLQMWSFLWSVETAPASCCTTPEDWSFVWSPSGSSTGPRGSLCLPPRVHTRPSPTRDLPCSCVLHANCGTGRVSQATPIEVVSQSRSRSAWSGPWTAQWLRQATGQAIDLGMGLKVYISTVSSNLEVSTTRRSVLEY